RFPCWGPGSGFAVEEVARRHGDFALAGAACGVQVDGGKVTRAAIALFGMGSTPLRAGAAEQAAVGAGAGGRDAGQPGRPAAAVRSCLIFAVQADGSQVTTVEGLSGDDGSLSPVQEAFRAEHGLQCGFCTPGFIVSVTAFLADNPHPTDDEIREGLSGNLCRC